MSCVSCELRGDVTCELRELRGDVTCKLRELHECELRECELHLYIRRAFLCVLSVLLSLSCNLLYNNPTNQDPVLSPLFSVPCSLSSVRHSLIQRLPVPVLCLRRSLVEAIARLLSPALAC